METEELQRAIEAILFAAGERIDIQRLAKISDLFQFFFKIGRRDRAIIGDALILAIFKGFEASLEFGNI